MAFFDIFNEDNFNVDNQQIEIQPTTISELKQEYLELGVIKTWNLGEQAARKDGTIVNRTYRRLTFSEDAIDFDLVNAGYNDDSLGGNYYWRVLHEFKETEYYSSNEPEYQNFKIWEKSINDYQMEITYDNLPTKYINNDQEVEAIFNWERPTTTQSFSGLGCPIGLVPAPINETGPSVWTSNGTTTNTNSSENTSTTSCTRYNSLDKPFYLVFDAGKSLGASISNFDLAPTTIYISTTPSLTTGINTISTAAGSTTDPHKMKYRYLIIKWDNPNRDDLTKVRVTFRGNERYRSFLPLIKDQEPECPEHLDITPYITHAPLNTPTRYKPPGEYNFPDNFWNDVEDIPLNNYATRLSLSPSIL